MESDGGKVEFTTLCSGSEGNCLYVQGGKTRILVDIGCSAKKAQEALQKIAVAPESINAILITHEHSDHIKGIDVFARRFQIPVYASPLTWQVLPFCDKLPCTLKQVFTYELEIDDLGITFFKTSHDACQPVGMVMQADGRSLGLLTDSGCAKPAMLKALESVDACVLEANHNLEMLWTGPYPMWLKKRVSGLFGHLSNIEAARILAQIAGPRLQYCILAHLSKTNNTPKVAVADFMAELQRLGVDDSFALKVAPRYEAGVIYHIV